MLAASICALLPGVGAVSNGAAAQDPGPRTDPAVALLADTAFLQRLTQGAMRKFRFGSAPAQLAQAVVQDAGERPVSLDAASGKLRLLAFWASWCAPCRTEIPSLQRLHSRLSHAGLEVVAVSLDKSAATADEALRSWGVAGLAAHFDAGARAAAALGVPGVPMTLLVDPDGREIGRLRGSAIWDSVEGILLIEAVLSRLTNVKASSPAPVRNP